MKNRHALSGIRYILPVIYVLTDQKSKILPLGFYLDLYLDTSTSYKSLKTRQRAERDNYPEHLSLRVHRALSWLNRAEQCDDDDGRFIFLWISFNAAYANETGEIRITEGRRVSDFLARLVGIDTNHRLSNIVWNNYSGSIRLLLENQFVYAPYWDHQNRLPNSDDWQHWGETVYPVKA